MRDKYIEKMVISYLKAYFNGRKEHGLSLLSNEEEWDRLTFFLNDHGLTPFFYQAVTSNRLPLDLPPKILKNWALTAKKNIVFNALLEKELGLIFLGLKERNIHPILLKGLALHHLYENILMRPSSDIDLFITRDEYEKVRDYLLESGYKYGMAKGFRGTNEQYIELQEKYCSEISFQKKLGSIALNVDLHWELDGIYDGSPLEIFFPVDKYPWHQYTRSDQYNEMMFKTLIPEAQFIHLAVHFALHHQFQGAKWFLDLVSFIHLKGTEMDWDLVDSIVGEPDCRKIIGVTLRLIENFMDDVPASVPKWYHFWDGSGLPGEFRYYKNRLFASPAKTGQYLGNVLLPLKLTSKAKVIGYYLFNKGAISLTRVSKGSGSSNISLLQPFYIVFRVFQEKKK